MCLPIFLFFVKSILKNFIRQQRDPQLEYVPKRTGQKNLQYNRTKLENMIEKQTFDVYDHQYLANTQLKGKSFMELINNDLIDCGQQTNNNQQASNNEIINNVRGDKNEDTKQELSDDSFDKTFRQKRQNKIISNQYINNKDYSK
ncbi:UNKNOWN [Stylonychia lemnae]|uniref:Uncharacterized protein n=1 Tax=Stylonychia lemnae TaxID=5949 RepID=A0A078BBE1_STYLE|nr:UNKNOWN [Stylonychia lemnae]|eukprot:CDW91714.1 UNKNOWN [Stylonychia lemnae]